MQRYKLYRSLQLIFIFSIFFYTITIDFVLILLEIIKNYYNCLILVICKYFKHIVLILEKNIFIAI